jgi:hypothetical protein
LTIRDATRRDATRRDASLDAQRSDGPARMLGAAEQQRVSRGSSASCGITAVL